MKVLALLAVLMWPSLAGAECAWVMWEHFVSSIAPQAWAIGKAYPTLAECETAAVRFSTDRMAQYHRECEGAKCPEAKEFSTHGNSITTRHKDGWVSTRAWVCYPDTVDPRAKQPRPVAGVPKVANRQDPSPERMSALGLEGTGWRRGWLRCQKSCRRARRRVV
jgi:hypothetical protein